MRFRQPYNLPELLTLLSGRQGYPAQAPWGLPAQSGVAQLRQVIRLAKEGIREYDHRLNALEKQVVRRDWDRDDGPNDPARRERAEDDPAADNYSSEEACDDSGETPCLNHRQLHHLFEKLAIQRSTLNRRGYPYTSDVNDEQLRVYPTSRLLTREEVEAAWDDWRDGDGKRLFRRYRGESGLDRTERRGGGHLDREEGDPVRDRGDRRENEAGDRELRRLSQEEFEAILCSLRQDGAELSRWGYPYTADIHDKQREKFEHTHPATAAEVERAFERWDGRRAYGSDIRREDDFEPDDGDEAGRSRAKGEENSREPHRSPAGERTFRIFDEILLSGELPGLSAVNRRLAERGEARFDDDEALQGEWREYLVVNAKAREEHIIHDSPRREVHGQRDEHDNATSHEPQRGAAVKVDPDAPGSERKSSRVNGNPVDERGNGRGRKPK